MKSSWWYRFIFFVIMVCWAVVMLVPTVMNLNPEGKYPVKSKINLGLDLQGGLYMVLGIDFQRAYKDEIKGFMRKFEYTLKDIGVATSPGELYADDQQDPQHSIVITDPSKVEEARKKIKEYFGNSVRLTHDKDNVLTYGLIPSLKTHIEENAVSKSIEVVRNRIDEFGVTEPEITSQGKDRIVVQLPGVKDIERAKELIGKTAKLEFRLVNDEINSFNLLNMVKKAEEENKIQFKKGDRFSDYLATINQKLKSEIPKGYEIAFQRKMNKFTHEAESMMPFLVEINPQLTGDDLQDAYVQIDQQKNEPYVSMTFKAQGAKRFEQVTGSNIGKRMAVILDGNVYTAPTIQNKIPGGHAQITLGYGSYNELIAQAKDIALVLRAGALPTPLEFEEQRIVGPSLGSDSIEKAKIAGFIGIMAIFILVLVYYRMSGVLGIICLFVNVLFILAILVGFDATLTLPGIAGIVLTVGMAVDATIIIYERIREELRRGASNFKSMEAGFQFAFWTIIDANITTALAAICLLNFGTGPIRGFAVTTLIGIVATIYSAYYVGKLLFEFYLNRVGGRELSI